jgi:hypothetical protein
MREEKRCWGFGFRGEIPVQELSIKEAHSLRSIHNCDGDGWGAAQALDAIS